ncbi:MAG: cellulase family glycosylhydrolase [Clostridia bacterium]|nr:cellulase family glycosylhydrolase [Clostridia bacterium]
MLKRWGIFRGVNLGGWLSQCDYSEQRLASFITGEDFARIASWQVDHIRLPVDYNVLQNEDGSWRTDGFERIDWALCMCRQYGLKMVLDLHKAAGFYWDVPAGRMRTELFSDAGYQERFWRLWEELARRYGGCSDCVAFELLNEVTEPRFINPWNDLWQEAVRRIRAIAPDTLILVGSYDYNSAAAVPALALPTDDRVAYNFHCYDPQPFTHQGAYWVDALDKSVRISFEESGVTQEYFEAIFAPAVQAAKERGAALYCGEYGVIDVASPEDAVKWIRTINAVFGRHGIPHCIWNYKEMDFSLIDSRRDHVRAELVSLL